MIKNKYIYIYIFKKIKYTKILTIQIYITNNLINILQISAEGRVARVAERRVASVATVGRVTRVAESRVVEV